jgi:hypothetical protein
MVCVAAGKGGRQTPFSHFFGSRLFVYRLAFLPAVVPLRAKRGIGDAMNILGQCSATDCDRRAVTSIEAQSVCLLHFIKTCDERLGEISKNMTMKSLDQSARETADRFTKESRERAADISKKLTELAIPERYRLLEIIFWATQLGGQLKSHR